MCYMTKGSGDTQQVLESCVKTSIANLASFDTDTDACIPVCVLQNAFKETNLTVDHIQKLLRAFFTRRLSIRLF